MCWERGCVPHPSLRILEDKWWNVLNRRTTCIQTHKQRGHRFPGKVQEFSDSFMALNSLPRFFLTFFFSDMWRTKKKTRNIRQTVIQVLCAAFLRSPRANCMTAQRLPQKKSPNDSTFFCFVSTASHFIYKHEDRETLASFVLSLIGNSVDVRERRSAHREGLLAGFWSEVSRRFPFTYVQRRHERFFQLIWLWTERSRWTVVRQKAGSTLPCKFLWVFFFPFCFESVTKKGASLTSHSSLRCF